MTTPRVSPLARRRCGTGGGRSTARLIANVDPTDVSTIRPMNQPSFCASAAQIAAYRLAMHANNKANVIHDVRGERGTDRLYPELDRIYRRPRDGLVARASSGVIPEHSPMPPRASRSLWYHGIDLRVARAAHKRAREEALLAKREPPHIRAFWLNEVRRSLLSM